MRTSRNVALVGAGLAVVGLGSLVLFAIAARTLDDAAFASFGVWFGLVNLLAFGLFVPLETAVARAMLGADGAVGRVLRQAATYGAIVLGGFVLLGIVLAPALLPRLFDDSWLLFVGAIAYLVVLAGQATQRGVAVGRNQFTPLFWQFAIDGTLRVLIPATLAVVGGADPVTLAFAVVASSTIALGAAQLVISRLAPNAEREALEPGGVTIDRPGLAALVVAALGAQLLTNGAPPVLALLARDDAPTMAAVVGALVLTRAPLLFASAVQAPLLPPLVASILEGDVGAVWALMRRVGYLLGGLYGLAFVAGWLIGGPVLEVYLGGDFGVPNYAMALLASAGVALLAAIAVQAALVAVSANAALASSWALGSISFLLVTAVPASGITSAPVAITVGTTVTLLAMLIGLRNSTVEYAQPVSDA